LKREGHKEEECWFLHPKLRLMGSREAKTEVTKEANDDRGSNVKRKKKRGY
jgi:hypothetical protein